MSLVCFILLTLLGTSVYTSNERIPHVFLHPLFYVFKNNVIKR